MIPESERDLIKAFEMVLGRIAAALERLSPPKEDRPRQPAHLGTATYTREERDKKELREKLRGKKPDGIQGNQAG